MGIKSIQLALRRLGRDWTMALAAVVTLGLGVGVSSAVFAILNAVLLRDLPFAEPARLVDLGTRHPKQGQLGVSYLDYRDWQVIRGFDGLAVYRDDAMTLSEERRAPVRLVGTYLSSQTFGLLGVQPLLGRGFVLDDDQPAAAPVAILSHRAWISHYNKDSTIVGRVVRVNGSPATIIGVMGEGFGFPMISDLWQPLSRVSGLETQPRDDRSWSVLGRLAPGTSHARARAELSQVMARLARDYPETNRDVEARLVSLRERYIGPEVSQLMFVLLAAVLFVQLIACANVATALLARAVQRLPEMATRVALGATRGRIVAQLVIESLVLACIAGLLGLGLSVAGLHWFAAAVASTDPPFWIQFTFDPRVFLFVLVLSLASGVFFGLVPGLHVSMTNVRAHLQEAGRGGVGGRWIRRWANASVAIQLTLTVVLLAGAGLMVASFVALQRIDLGIDTSGLTVLRLDLPPAAYDTKERRAVFYQGLEDRLGTSPVFRAATLTNAAPGAVVPGLRKRIGMEGGGDASDPPTAIVLTAGDKYFETLGVTLRQGRGFGPTDGTPGRDVAIVNDRFVALHFGGRDPVGQRIKVGGAPTRGATPVSDAGASEPWLTVIGVAPAIRQRVFEPEFDAIVYVPFRSAVPSTATLLVGGPDAAAIARHVRAEVQSLDPDLAVFDVETLDHLLASYRWPQRVFGAILAVLAIIALTLSGVGLYGIAAHAVTQRTREIGVRMALGAEPRDVLWLVVRQCLVALGTGLAIGLFGAFAIRTMLQAFLVSGTAGDLPVLAGAIALLVVIAMAACVWPVRRATRVDPIQVLR